MTSHQALTGLPSRHEHVAAYANDNSSELSEQARPALHVVAAPTSPTVPGVETPGSPQEPNVGRWAAIGAAIGFAVMTVAITAAGTLCGLGFAGSLGLGVFVGIWGGAGSGFMMGATIPLSRYLDAVQATRPHRLAHGAPDVPETAPDFTAPSTEGSVADG